MATQPVLKVSTQVKAGQMTVYGTATCPWCKKQVDYLKSNEIPFTFVDCVTEECPDTVKAFPTTVIVGFHKF